MPENLVTVDGAAILALLHERPLRIAGECRGELAWLLGENPGLRMRYTRRDGIALDAYGEALLDRGYVTRSVTEREIIDILEQALRRAARPQHPRGGRRRKATANSVDSLEQKYRKMRCRKFQCDRCQDIVRGTRNTNVICGRCYDQDGDIRRMRRIDPLPEEILEQAAAIDAAA